MNSIPVRIEKVELINEAPVYKVYGAILSKDGGKFIVKTGDSYIASGLEVSGKTTCGGPFCMTIIIAEAGVNHNGCLKMAFKLVEAAAMAGADIVKFQTFKAEELATYKANKAKYQLETTDPDECQQKMLKRLELSNEDHIQLVQYCKNIGIEFFVNRV